MDEWTLTLDGQLRPRFIAHTGLDFRGKRSPVREFVTQRARIGATMAHETGPALTLRLQDVRTWGEETNTLGDFDANGFDAHEAFAVIPMLDGLSLKIGRQEIIMDNHRLVGNVGWTQRGRSFDGARVTYAAKPVSVDVFYAKVREADENPEGTFLVPEGDDLDFAGVHAGFTIADSHTIAPMFLVNAIHFADHVRETAGLNASGKVGGFAYTGEFYYQFGHVGDETVSAFLGAARAGYTFDVAVKPHLTAWGEVLSGDGTPEGTFDTMYATNHKFYGEMDYFLNIPLHTATLGLVDLGGRAGFRPVQKVGVHVDAHHFRSVESDGAGNNTFGTELDLKVVVDVMTAVQTRVLYGMFFAGEAMRTARPAVGDGDLNPEAFGYVTLDVKF